MLPDHERQVLTGWVRGHSAPQTLALRARIVLGCAEIEPDELPRSAGSVGEQVASQLEGLGGGPRPGRIRTISEEKFAKLVRITLETRPKNATHWMTRSMAAKTGMSQSAVSRSWREFGLQSHRAESFKLSTDPFFVRQGPRRRWALPQSARAGRGAVCRREVRRIQAPARGRPVRWGAAGVGMAPAHQTAVASQHRVRAADQT